MTSKQKWVHLISFNAKIYFGKTLGTMGTSFGLIAIVNDYNLFLVLISLSIFFERALKFSINFYKKGTYLLELYNSATPRWRCKILTYYHNRKRRRK